MDNRRESSST